MRSKGATRLLKSAKAIAAKRPQSQYFAAGKVARDQVIDYARREGMSLEQAEGNLAPNLGYLPQENNEREVA